MNREMEQICKSNALQCYNPLQGGEHLYSTHYPNPQRSAAIKVDFRDERYYFVAFTLCRAAHSELFISSPSPSPPASFYIPPTFNESYFVDSSA